MGHSEDGALGRGEDDIKDGGRFCDSNIYGCFSGLGIILE